jgi:type IV pilus assembly protein PilY1
VLVTSGYNNVSPGTGRGYLYVLNAATGAIISKIDTGQGSTGTPSGLSRINAWVNNAMTDNTTLQAYGGDLLGNLWRFDINGDVGAAGIDAQLLAFFRGPSGAIQPITAKPELGEVDGHDVVFVGTGRYLGASDLTDSSQQSFYAIKDPLDTTSWGNVRGAGDIVQQILTNSVDPVTGAVTRTATTNPVSFATKIGWFIDFPDTGERNTTDPSLALGTLVFTTNVPSSNPCTLGGYSWLYYLDYRTGSVVSTAVGGFVATRLGNALATRPVLVRLPNNTIVSLTKLSDTTINVSNVPIAAGVPGLRRIFWRELIIE